MQLNRRNNTVSVLNKGIDAARGPWSVSVAAYDVISGVALPLEPPFVAGIDVLPANTVTHVPARLQQPPSAPLGATVIYRVNLARSDSPPAGRAVSTADYLLSTLSTNATVPQNFSALAATRYGRNFVSLHTAARGRVTGVDHFGRTVFEFNVTMRNPGPSVAVALSVSLRSPSTAVIAETGFVDDRVLPQWADDGLFHLLRGEEREIRIEAAVRVPASCSSSLSFFAVISGWNVAKSNVSVVMT